MIEFMVIAAPRSGTAWCSNWLTDNVRHCLHDPLYDHHYEDFDAITIPRKRIGVACTGLGLFPEWVSMHPARKVILHRDRDEVNQALRSQGLPKCPHSLFKGLESIAGLHVQWTDLFRNPAEIWQHLFPGEELDVVRHKHLAQLNVTSNWRARVQDQNVLDRLRKQGIADTA